jgi:hypothetical protein
MQLVLFFGINPSGRQVTDRADVAFNSHMPVSSVGPQASALGRQASGSYVGGIGGQKVPLWGGALLDLPFWTSPSIDMMSYHAIPIIIHATHVHHIPLTTYLLMSAKITRRH